MDKAGAGFIFNMRPCAIGQAHRSRGRWVCRCCAHGLTATGLGNPRHAAKVAGSGVTVKHAAGHPCDVTGQSMLDGACPRRKTSRSNQARLNRHKTNPAGRYGDREEFWPLCAFLCSVRAASL